jgi:hypothetical protein
MHNKSLIKYTTQVCGEEKAKDLAAKDQLHKEKLDKATSHLLMAASAMNHQNYALCGSTFPLPRSTQSYHNSITPAMPTQSHHNSLGSLSIRACSLCCRHCQF